MGGNVLVAEKMMEETVQNTGFRALVESLSGHLETGSSLERGKSTGAKIKKTKDSWWLQHHRLISSGVPCQDPVLL